MKNWIQTLKLDASVGCLELPVCSDTSSVPMGFPGSDPVFEDYHLYALLAPHLGNRGAGNTAWIDEYKGMPMLFGERAGDALALACSVPWVRRSAGFVGISDGWQDLMQHKQMLWHYTRAENGNVALTGEVDLNGADGRFVLALGFGRNTHEAGQRALASLLDGFDAALAEYTRGWQAWQQTLHDLQIDCKVPAQYDLYRISTLVMRVHEAKRFPGGLIASLSIPWGSSKGDDDLGGYHLVWPRDLVEVAGGLLAAGAAEDARRVLDYLQVTQEADGHWPQNMWLDGRSYWGGIQMDETADAWNDSIERWIYVAGTDLARQSGVEGYYVRNAPPEVADAASPAGGFVPIKNRPPGDSSKPAAQSISPDALALVRFGLRAADDPRIVNTVKVIDALLKVETPAGPAWRRYNDDRYGEHEDGGPFDGTGVRPVTTSR